MTSMVRLPGCQHSTHAQSSRAEEERQFAGSHSLTRWSQSGLVRGELSTKIQQSQRKRGTGGRLLGLVRGSAKGHQCCIWHAVTLYRNVDTSHPEQEAKPEWAVRHRSMAWSLGDPSGWLNLHLFPSPNLFVLCRPDSHSQQFDTFPTKK